jgi:hypothetical protein
MRKNVRFVIRIFEFNRTCDVITGFFLPLRYAHKIARKNVRKYFVSMKAICTVVYLNQTDAQYCA